jgi:serine/threonine-protein kinase PknK
MTSRRIARFVGAVVATSWALVIAPLPSAAAQPESAQLTPREREVAGLIAAGMTNKQIAAKLVVSQRTARGHVENIFTKLGFNTRSQVATWYAERASREEEQ